MKRIRFAHPFILGWGIASLCFYFKLPMTWTDVWVVCASSVFIVWGIGGGPWLGDSE